MGQNEIVDFAHFESCASYFDKIFLIYLKANTLIVWAFQFSLVRKYLAFVYLVHISII